jgi:hypothetical protein
MCRIRECVFILISGASDEFLYNHLCVSLDCLMQLGAYY